MDSISADDDNDDNNDDDDLLLNYLAVRATNKSRKSIVGNTSHFFFLF